MENYYQRNMDQFECDKPGSVSYNQLLDYIFHEDSGAEAMPVTLAEVKNFCKIDDDITEDDSLLEDTIIPAAVQLCEDETNVGFIRRTVTAIFNNGNGGFYLPYGPIGEIESTTDTDGGDIAADVQGAQWKQVLSPRLHRMNVTYQAGYETLPQKLKIALLNAIMYLYDNRSQGLDDIGPIAKSLLNPYRRIW